MSEHNQLADELDYLLSQHTVTSAAPTAPATSTEPTEYRERCPKCNGSGRFYGYRGGDCGPCFPCKGQGFTVFKTSTEARAKARDAKQRAKASAADESIAAFVAEFPTLWAWIEANPGFEFALSLRDDVAKFGRLTDNQRLAVQRCMEREATREAAKVERVTNAPTLDVGKIEEAFARAKTAGLSRPFLLLDCFKFTLAPMTGRNAGAVYVKTLADAGSVYLGKIGAGRFFRSGDCTDDQEARIIAACADPAAAAKLYGIRTGNCSCCGRELTNPESIARGIGPICADKFGF